MLGNVLTEYARALMHSVADAGVRDVIVSPGSRSTPYVTAAVRDGRLSCHSVVDERAAAFLALGQARVSGRPSLLLCTSGSAAAHYLPAIVEAAMAYIPLLVLTADRPPELHECHSPQTIDQVKMYGDYARRFFDLVPQSSEVALRALRRTIAQAVAATRWPLPGAVHVNARAAKPLEPATAKTEDERDLAERARRVLEQPITEVEAPRTLPSASAVARAVELCRGARRGLIVAGPASLDQSSAADAVASLARATGFPVWAEAPSQLRFSRAIASQTDALDWVWRTPSLRERCKPDLVVQIGSPPVSSAWDATSGALPRIVLAAHGWQDPWSSARAMVFGDVAESARALADAFGARAAESEYARELGSSNARAWDAVDRALASEPFGEGAAMRAIVSRAPRGSLLVVGNSLSVRLVDIYAKHASNELGVLSQRGASGIDGLVAGAAGASLASDRPVTLVLGDVSLLHDLTSLSLAKRARAPLVVVVLNNGGGRIFEQLPIAKAGGIEREILDLTITPHQENFGKAAALYELPHARVASVPELASALGAAYARTGASVVEVALAPHGAAETQARIVAMLGD